MIVAVHKTYIAVEQNTSRSKLYAAGNNLEYERPAFLIFTIL